MPQGSSKELALSKRKPPLRKKREKKARFWTREPQNAVCGFQRGSSPLWQLLVDKAPSVVLIGLDCNVGDDFAINIGDYTPDMVK